MTPFHLAFLVADLDATRVFYGDVLGCPMGRAAPTWQDFDFFGHQMSAHLGARAPEGGGSVDGKTVPVPHFGAVLDLAAWDAMAARVRAAGLPFLVEPQTRFAGEPGEQRTFFITDPAGNAIEFKGFRDLTAVFGD